MTYVSFGSRRIDTGQGQEVTCISISISTRYYVTMSQTPSAPTSFPIITEPAETGAHSEQWRHVHLSCPRHQSSLRNELRSFGSRHYCALVLASRQESRSSKFFLEYGTTYLTTALCGVVAHSARGGVLATGQASEVVAESRITLRNFASTIIRKLFQSIKSQSFEYAKHAAFLIIHPRCHARYTGHHGTATETRRES